MKSKLRAKMFDDLKAWAGRRDSKPIIRHARLGVALVFALISYVGLLISSVFFSFSPFKLLADLNFRPPSVAYWIIASLILTSETALLVLLIFVARRAYVRKREVSIDIIIGSVGIGLAILLMFHIYFNGVIPFM